MDWTVPITTSGSITSTGVFGQITLSQVCSQHALQTNVVCPSGTSGQAQLDASLDGENWYGVSGSTFFFESGATTNTHVVMTGPARFLRFTVVLFSGTSADVDTALTSRS